MTFSEYLWSFSEFRRNGDKCELSREEDKQKATFRVRDKISPEHNQDEILGEQMMETDHSGVW
jgi:hypothetical protein